MTLYVRRPNRSILGEALSSGKFNAVTITLLGFAYSLLFVLFPWEYLLGFTFPDKLNYIDRFVQLQFLGPDSINPLGGILGAFISESLWGLILYWLGAIGCNAEQALLLISFVCICSIVIFVFSRLHPAIGAIFLLNPLIVDFVMAQQRSALVFAGFLSFVSTKSYVFRLLIALACIFVHIAFALLLAGYYMCLLLEKLRFAKTPLFNRASHLMIVFAVAVVILVGKDFVLGVLGDRRAGGHEGSQSLMYASFWLGLAIYIVIFSRSRIDWLFDFGLLFVGLFLVAVVLNTYSSRFLVFALPFIVIVLAKLNFREAVLSYLFLYFYQFLQWIYWWKWFI